MSARVVAVVGAGAAGLSAAVAAAETAAANGSGTTVVLLDRAPDNEAGGNTRWTDAYLRLQDVYEPAENFAEDMIAFSDGRTDADYVDALLEELPETMDWVQGHGVRFHRRPTYFVTASRPRMMPVGGGESIVRQLTAAARELGVEIRYSHRVTGVRAVGDAYELTFESGAVPLSADVVVVASGGFEGSPEMLAEHIGPHARDMHPIAPGGALNTGDVVESLIELGAARGGEWSNFHGEPVDSRSDQSEASVMTFGYGIVVDENAERFFDEGASTADENYEDLSRAILERSNQRAFLISDAEFDRVPGIERGMLTDRKPVTAASIEELADALGLDRDALRATIAKFNNAAPADGGSYDPTGLDGCATERLDPPKSNWARPIVEAPFIGVPLIVDIVFTYGGVATDAHARVVDGQGAPMRGLYAAGECTGIYYGKYPGATSVLRGLVFGRLAGINAVREAAEVPNND
ncbi:FAD-dependent tricarballylate dehydrogenase TcuA [Microbacterium pseudoresistens]|uniref:Tricarballylate dehydrogenase n=1 Tax=Microbacterium pseudoresistens TaxID=640634 RepID=A0A7Y9EVR4_9MICO|nr:tricarballylate dehydrogenase [Microbacterium pseudoresistens]